MAALLLFIVGLVIVTVVLYRKVASMHNDNFGAAMPVLFFAVLTIISTIVYLILVWRLHRWL